MADKLPHSKDIKKRSTHLYGSHPSKKAGNIRSTNLREEEKKTGFHLLEKISLTTSDIIFILNPRNKRIESFISPPKNQAPFFISSPRSSMPGASEVNFLDLIFPEDTQFLWLKLEHFTLKSKEEVDECEVRLKDKNGTIRFFNFRFTPYKIAEDNKVLEWFCHLRESTRTHTLLQEISATQVKLQMALECSGMGSWTYDVSSKKIFCDDRCCALLGLNENEFEGDLEPFFINIHKEDKCYAQTMVTSMKDHKGQFSFTLRIVPPGLEAVRNLTFTGKKVTSNDSESPKVNGVCFDSDLKRQTEKKVRTNEKFLEESQRIAKIGCFDWDLTLDKVHLTNQMYSILGITPEAPLLLKSFYQHVHPQDRKEVEKTIKSTIKKGGGFSKEFRYSPVEGETKVLWVQGLARRNSQKRTTHLVGTFQDITEKKEKEREIKTQNLIIKSILHNLPVIIQIIDKNGIVRKLLGAAGLRRLNMEENQTVGENIFQQSSEISHRLKKVLKGETVNFMESVFRNGRQLTFLNYYFYDAERELAIGFSIDISAQKQTEAAFQEVSAKNRELERMNQVMDMFVYATAHDLKNPINNLELLSTLLKDATTQQEQNEYLGALQKSVFRLKQTIQGLTEILEIESSKGLQSKRVKFNEILNHVLADLDPLLKEKKGTLEVRFKKESINYNKAFLISILKNLLSNAIKYSDTRRIPQIEISTEKRNGYVLLTVSDNGIGIDLPQYRANLFKPFKRFTSQAEGTGIGLHLIKSMVEKNGGYIEIESTPGQGTSFHCYLLPFED